MDSIRIAECSPSLSEWVSVLSTGFAMVSALAAVAAIGLAFANAKEQRKAREADRQRFLYQRLVLDVSLAALPKFVTETGTKLDKAQLEIATLDPDLMTHRAVRDQAKASADAFNGEFFQLRNTIRGALITWNDDTLSDAVDGQLQNLQDAVITSIITLTTDHAAKGPISAVVVDYAARVQQVVAGYDAVRRPARGNAERA